MSSPHDSESSSIESNESDLDVPPTKRKKWMTGNPVPRSTVQRWLAQMPNLDDDHDDDNENDEEDHSDDNNSADRNGNDLYEEPNNAEELIVSQDEDCASDSNSMSSSDASSLSTDNSTGSNTGSDTTRESAALESDPPMSESLYPGAELTKGEAVSRLLDLCCRHAASKSLIGDLVKFTFEILPKPNTFPATFYLFEQTIDPYVPPELAVIQYCCENCGVYLGSSDEVRPDCGVCEETKMKSFYEFPLATQIRYLFEERNLADAIDSYAAKVGDISDITKGDEYLRVKSRVNGKYDVVLLSSTDGLRPHKNSEEEIWALTYTICEVPPSLRKVFTLVSQIWCGKKKPRMNGFMKPFAESLQKLYSEGVTWTHPKTKVGHTTKGTAPVFTLDAPARAMVQNITHFSGYFSCNICEIEGERIACGKGSKTVFPFDDELHLRTEESMEIQTQNLLDTGTITKGIRGGSILNSIPLCNRSSGVIMDYMHLVLIGVTSQFFKKFFTLKKKRVNNRRLQENNAWYIGNKSKQINCFLSSIRRIYELTRFPKNVDKFKNFKASTWLTWLLYVSVPALQPHLPEEFFQHWLLLVIAVNLLLQESINEDALEMSRLLLSTFVEDAERLYGKDIMSHNVHGLQHLSIICKRWGGLWSHSCFLFESFNGVITRNLHGTIHISEEFGNVLGRHVANVTLKNQLHLEKDNLSSSTVVKGKEFYTELTAEELQLIREHVPNAQQRIPVFSRVQQGKTVFTSLWYTAEHATDNKNVLFKTDDNKKVFGILKFFYNNGGDVLAFINGFDVDEFRFKHNETNLSVTHIIRVHESEAMCVVPFKNILSKVIKVGQYVCIPPNRFERNL